jgi:hypothetical protein
MKARIALTAAALSLTAAAPAHAAVTIGSPLTTPPTLTRMCAGGCTLSPVLIPNHLVTAPGPGPGVITRWSVGVGGTTGPMALQVLHRSAGSGSGMPGVEVARSSPVTPPANDTTTFPARIRIAAGDFIGLACCEGPGASVVINVTTSAFDIWEPAVGASASSATGSDAFEVAINADVESDGDSDGFGDETQDTCPGIPQAVQSDRDHDGFGDACDTCPDVAGAAPRGCPGVAGPPPVPNKPPTARFRTPRSGTGVGPTVRIELDAADDHGLPVVSVFDDDGTICVLRAAPYTCTWRPTAADVGRATLLASAVDSGGLSSLAIVRVRVSRFAAKLTKKAKRSGGRLKVSGRLVLPPVVTRAQGCSGRVSVRVRTARRTVRLTRRCTYSVRLKVRTGRPRVRFRGNSVIAPT